MKTDDHNEGINEVVKMRELTKEEAKEKIRIVHSKLNAYLNDIKAKDKVLQSSIYYAMLGELDILNRFIFDDELSNEEKDYVNECLGILKLTYGRHHYSFIEQPRYSFI